MIEYDGVTDFSNFLKINIYFEASESFDITWYLNNEKLDISQEPDVSEPKKYFTECIHVQIFSYECFLFIDPYTKQDVGKYSAILKLKSRPDVYVELKSHAIMPSKIFSLTNFIDEKLSTFLFI